MCFRPVADLQWSDAGDGRLDAKRSMADGHGPPVHPDVTEADGRLLVFSDALRSEFVKLDEIKADGQSDQGVNGANVAAVLFFWPAAVGNYMSARDALAVAERRHSHLMTIYNSKQCDNPANANLSFMVPSSLLGPIERSVGVSH